MTTFRSTAATFCVLGTVIFSNPASASLIGDTISASGGSVTPVSTTIGPAVEFSGIHGNLDFDFSANTLTISSKIGLTSWFGFGSYTFSDFDDIITSFSLASNTGFTGDFLTDFSFTSNSITLNMDFGQVINSQQGDVAVFNINSTAKVPEPSTFALMGLALAGIGVVRRRKVA